MTLADILIAELEREAAPTRKALERVPDDKLTWRPHEKSMTLGQLAQHIATIPGGIAQMSLADTFDMSNFSKPPELESAAALVPTWEKNVAKAKDILSELDDETMRKNWSLTKGGQTVIAVPRIGLFRTDSPEPPLPPSRTANGLPAAPEHSGSVDLRTECGRESVRLGRQTGGQRGATRGLRLRRGRKEYR